MSRETQNITDIVEVKGRIGRIENHMKLFKEAQELSDTRHVENSKKLDLLVNTFTDTPFNAGNGLIKRINEIEKKVSKQDFYWQVAVGCLGGGAGLWFLVKVIFNIEL